MTFSKALFALTVTSAMLSAGTTYFQGFESGASNWWGDTLPVAVTSSGIAPGPSSGSHFGVVTNTPDGYQPGYGDAAYTRLGRNPGDVRPYVAPYWVSIDVYIDPSLQPTNPDVAAFWIDQYPVALNGVDPWGDEHDFAFFYKNGTTTVKVDNGVGPTLATITNPGWYRFVETFARNSDPDKGAINTFSVYTPTGASLGNTYTVNSNLASKDMGGAGILWMTLWQNGFSGNQLAIDNVQVYVTPEPATLALIGGGLAAIAFARRRRA